jgi:hypothetical protein
MVPVVRARAGRPRPCAIRPGRGGVLASRPRGHHTRYTWLGRVRHADAVIPGRSTIDGQQVARRKSFVSQAGVLDEAFQHIRPRHLMTGKEVR